MDIGNVFELAQNYFFFFVIITMFYIGNKM